MDKKPNNANHKLPSRAFIRSLIGKYKGKKLLDVLAEEKIKARQKEDKR